MILFDSDYQEGCLPQILEALAKTNMEQTPGYGLDPYCEKAKDLIREECGTPDAAVHFLVGGTQTNATVVSYILKSYQGAICADTGHINVHETGAVEHTGHKVLVLPSRDGKITATQIDHAMTVHDQDCVKEHTVQPGLVYISFPTECGSIYYKSELEDIHAVCVKWGLPLFIDGARMGYGLCAEDCDVTIKDIAALADAFYIGGTKQGALFGEAVVFRNKDFAPDFRYSIKQNGAMLAKGRLLGIQFEVLFTDGLYYKASREADRKAMRIRDAFRKKGITFLVDSTTNQQFPILNEKQMASLAVKFSFEQWQKLDAGRCAARFCTSWATTDEAVDQLISEIKKL
ncbi:MAG: low specificity L-threonine aldolase [Bacteroidales bacterium]|nr:low specificity L-threonine aldolase [Bacteroidales bacterium]